MLLLVAVLIGASWPVKSHVVAIDLPYTLPRELWPDRLAEVPVVDVGVTASGKITWNGNAVSEGELRQRLADADSMEVTPGINFEPDDKADYATSLKALAILAEAGLEPNTLCFGGIERNRDFGSQFNAAKRSKPTVPCNLSVNRGLYRTD